MSLSKYVYNTHTHTHTNTHKHTHTSDTQRLHAKDEASGRLGEKKESTKKKKPKMGMVDSFKFLVQQVFLN